MHELSVVMSIVKTADEEVEKAGGGKVSEIFLEIGKLSGVEIESLNFVWEQCVEGSSLSFARKNITEPLGRAKCIECEAEFDIEKLYDNCPQCNSPFKEILRGKEMKIKKLVII